jgi:hypothetical protein
MKTRRAGAIAIAGWYLMVQYVLLVPVVSAHVSSAQPPTPADPNWCSEVPASPAPPHFDGHYGTWAAARKQCTSTSRDIYFCGDLCMAAKDLWNMEKVGVFDRADSFPSATAKQQGPFALPGGANGYILPAAPSAAPTSDSSRSN